MRKHTERVNPPNPPANRSNRRNAGRTGISNDVGCVEEDVQRATRTCGPLAGALYRNLCEDLSAQGLYARDFYPGITPDNAAASRIRASLLKKFEVEGNRIADDAARLKFLAVNERCKGWSLRGAELNSWDEELIGNFRKVIDDFFHPKGQLLVSSYWDIFHNGGVGPGAGLGSAGGDFYTKLFSSPLTTTSTHLYDMYKAYTKLIPEWGNAEIIREANYGSARVVRGNRLSFVPKNVDISRVICTEPVLNMYAQLGLANLLNQRLSERFGIDLRRQQFKNRELARLGSIDGRFSTIDLESASDSISLGMLRTLFPAWFVATLEELRSPVTTDAAVERELHMISTMGNGYTFALQTIIFAAVVESAYKQRGIVPLYPRGLSTGNFGVNGDDIICVTETSCRVVRLLEILGFTVNHSKSFFEGPFRESCGGDFFLGRQIRGVYVKRLDTKQDLYVVINQLNFWSAKTGIRLSRAVGLLTSMVDWLEVPRWEDDSAGIKVPYSMLKDRMLCRNTGSLLYRPWVATGKRIRITERRIVTPRGVKTRIYNLSGLLIAFLQRSINDGCIGFRQKPVQYRRKLRVAPYWDAMPEVSSVAEEFSWRRWETACYANFNEAFR